MVSNNDDIIDSRAVQARIEELEGSYLPFGVKMAGSGMPVIDSFETFDEALEFRQAQQNAPALVVVEIEQDEDEREELEILREFRDNVDNGEWSYGITLIRESYFDEDFAKQEAQDLGIMRRDMEGWPFSYIDWDAAADALREDYADAEFDGVTYLYRS